MTAELNPLDAVTNEDTGERWYPIPDGNGGWLRLLSVTTAFRSIAKIGLIAWAATLAAEAAFTELPTVISASRKKPCGKTHARCRHDWQETCDGCPCGVCRACMVKWLADRQIAESSRRSDEGKRVHDVIEWWSQTGQWREYITDIAPYVEAFKSLVVEYGLRPDSFLMCEATCINKADLYAGTTDGIIRFETTASPAAAKLVARVLRARGEYGHIKTGKALINAVIRDKRYVDLIVDWKTREKPEPKFYPEQALQVAGYRWAPTVRIKNTDVEVPMPDTDGGVVIQLRPDGATPRLAVCDERTYAGFLHALRLYLWLVEEGPRAIGAYTFPLDLKPQAAAPSDTPQPDPFALVPAAPGPVDDAAIPF